MATNASLISQFDHEDEANSFYRLALSGCQTSGGLAIAAGGSADVKFANTVTYQIGGVLKAKTTATADLSALAPKTIADDFHTVVSVFLDAAGNVTANTATPVAITETIPALPDYADTLVCIGAVVIKNETGSNFVVGTTALDKTGVTTTYYNFGTAFPKMVIGA